MSSSEPSQFPRPIDLPRVVNLDADADRSNLDAAKIIAGPSSLIDRSLWRDRISKWRLEARNRLAYVDAEYQTRSNSGEGLYSLALVWLWDELLFDFDTQAFTPERLFSDSLRFGGFDGVILWHAYPVIGVDSRNQFDFYNQVDGLKELISAFHSRDIKVFINYNPWDRWTSRSANSDQENLEQLVGDFNFDGVFLDTIKSVDASFHASIKRAKSNAILGGESSIQLENIENHLMSWAQWVSDSEIPGVLRARWFEPGHMMFQTRRWNRSHREELQIAWLNGSGMLIWEVVFGTWVGWSDRDVRMVQEMSKFQRKNHESLTKGIWTPLAELTHQAENSKLFASRFDFNNVTIWMIVNKGEADFEGEVLDDVSASVPAGGIAAVTREDSKFSVDNFTYQYESSDFPNRITRRISEGKSEVVRGASLRTVSYEGLVKYKYRNSESGLYGTAPYLDAWKPLPPNYHQILDEESHVRLSPFEIDEYEVSNLDFHNFIVDSGYVPISRQRFLAHWKDGKPSEEQLLSPLTFVDINDARAFARWKGGRLPSEWEWQIAESRGLIRRLRPHVWNLTGSEHTDGRTRFVLLKGGSEYAAQGKDDRPPVAGILESDWYLPGGIKEGDYVAKLLLMGLGMSRSENISFRCAYDVE